jgi:hypothetical protein
MYISLWVICSQSSHFCAPQVFSYLEISNQEVLLGRHAVHFSRSNALFICDEENPKLVFDSEGNYIAQDVRIHNRATLNGVADRSVEKAIQISHVILLLKM